MQGGTEEYPSTFTAQSEQMNEISYTFPFDYKYDTYPQDIVLFFKVEEAIYGLHQCIHNDETIAKAAGRQPLARMKPNSRA